MALTNAQYDEIMREYDRTQLKHSHLQENRKKEIYKVIPEFIQLDKEITDFSIDIIRRSREAGTPTAPLMKEKAEQIRARKEELLESHGYPIDYLDMTYDCPDCKDTGYISNKICHCLKSRILTVLYKQSNIEEILKNENFDVLTFDYYLDSEYEQMNTIINRCKDYVRDFDSKHSSILFMGEPGVGKTFLTNCIAKELLDSNHSVIYFTSSQLFDTLSKYVFRSGELSEDIKNVHEDIFSCDLLIIDDLGTEVANSFVLSQLFLIINERGLRNKSTIISTNLDFEQLEDKYDERIVSRLCGGYIVIHPMVRDIRIEKRKMNNRK